MHMRGKERERHLILENNKIRRKSLLFLQVIYKDLRSTHACYVLRIFVQECSP